MFTVSKDFWSSKSTWLGIAFIVKTIAVKIWPEIRGLDNTIDSIFIALAGIFARDAIVKAGAEPAKIKAGARRSDA